MSRSVVFIQRDTAAQPLQHAIHCGQRAVERVIIKNRIKSGRVRRRCRAATGNGLKPGQLHRKHSGITLVNWALHRGAIYDGLDDADLFSGLQQTGRCRHLLLPLSGKARRREGARPEGLPGKTAQRIFPLSFRALNFPLTFRHGPANLFQQAQPLFCLPGKPLAEALNHGRVRILSRGESPDRTEETGQSRLRELQPMQGVWHRHNEIAAVMPLSLHIVQAGNEHQQSRARGPLRRAKCLKG